MKISVRGLHYVYASGVRALDGIDLEVASGSRLGIVGQNGAGKTTLVRHFNGIFQPTEGEVEIGDCRRRVETLQTSRPGSATSSRTPTSSCSHAPSRATCHSDRAIWGSRPSG